MCYFLSVKRSMKYEIDYASDTEKIISDIIVITCWETWKTSLCHYYGWYEAELYH
jgi:hypothetical protein